VSVKVEGEQESILILFVISSRFPGDTSEASTASPCLLDFHQHHGWHVLVNSLVDTLLSPFVAIGSPVEQFERNHRFFHAARNYVKDKFLVLSWCHFWAPWSFWKLAWLLLNVRIRYRGRIARYCLWMRTHYRFIHIIFESIGKCGLLMDWLSCRILQFFLC